MGVYIYCVTLMDNNGIVPVQELDSSGLDEQKIYTVCYDDIGAVVSDTISRKYPVNRENSLAHEKAIESAMRFYTVLPVRFCTIADNVEKVKKILQKEYIRFKELLVKMQNKVELGIKAIFNEEFIYPYIVKKYENIRLLKEKIEKLPADKTYFSKMEIGRQIEAALGQEKEIHKEKILSILKDIAEDVKVNITIGERMIVNAAFLVDKDKESEFDRRVNELSDMFKDAIKFKFVGNLPAFNFINLVINTGEY